VQFKGGVDDFVLSFVHFEMANPDRDPQAKYASVVPCIDFDNTMVSGVRHHPTNGVISDVSSHGAVRPVLLPSFQRCQVFGYGTVQMESAEGIHFENIDGEGGATLRLETDGMKGAYVNNITGKNITCRDGHAAFIAEPHNQDNGVFSVQGVTSLGCRVAVELNGGYVRDGKAPGWFGNGSSVRDVVGVFGRHAQSDKDHGDEPSCAPCGTENSKLNYVVEVDNVSAVGFPAPSNRSQCLFWKRPHCPFTNQSKTALLANMD